MKRLIKRAAFSLAEALQVNRRSLQKRRNHLLVLGYHGILSAPRQPPFRYHHTAPEFEAHLEWLGTHCTPIGLADLERWFEGWTPPKPPVLITFDDGYRNNSTTAAPLLRKAGFPGVFFLSTAYIDSDQIMWTDEVFLRVQSWPDASIENTDGSVVPLPPSGPARHTLGYALAARLKRSTNEKRLQYLDYLRRESAGVNVLFDPDAQAFMTWAQARDLAVEGFDLGSHTVTHPILSRISPAQLNSEVSGSRASIREKAGSPCRAIAYPNGQPEDTTPEVLSRVEHEGYEWAFVVSGHWQTNRNSRYAIERIVPPGHSDRETFAFVASGNMNRLKDL